MRRKSITLVVCALLLVVLIPVLYYLVYVPHSLGKQYVTVHFRPRFYSYAEGSGNVEVLYKGRPLKCNGVEVRINITNSYLVPVNVKYNGFNVVLVIYNQTVTDPSDVVNNSNSLVWGAFHYFRKISRFWYEGFEFYASRREQTNFTRTIRAPTEWTNQPFFGGAGGSPAWFWDYWFEPNSFVPTGTYYMYCITFGIASDPQNFTITSVPW